MIQREFQLEVWTSLIQKSTVIPPSSMVLFRICLLSLCIFIHDHVLKHVCFKFEMYLSALEELGLGSWGNNIFVRALCQGQATARDTPPSPLCTSPDQPKIKHQLMQRNVNLKSNQISTAKKGQPKNQTKYYYYCKEMTTLKSNQISSAHANSQRIEHPLKSNQALNPGNGKNKQNWSSMKLYCTLWNFKANRLSLRP